MGRDLFDYAFKNYAGRWAFKHPHPARLFSAWAASGVNLDWFWQAGFGTEPVELRWKRKLVPDQFSESEGKAAGQSQETEENHQPDATPRRSEMTLVD